MPSPVTLAKGQVFAGEYRVLRRLGEGGMGGVYLAEQASTKAKRALKLMHPHLVSDETLRRRFEQEAVVSARIKSDHVVQVVGAGVDEPTGIPWIAMELLRGETLAKLAERSAPMPPEEVGAIFVQLGHALGAAHKAGIVHRDLKPENVFVAVSSRAGAPFSIKILDFGISKVLAQALTRSTEPVGTPLWMAPEQTMPEQAIDARADVWAMGLVAFYLLTGKRYWRSAQGDSNAMAVLREIAFEDLPGAAVRLKELGGDEGLLPDGFEAWFARAVVRDPEARFADATDAQIALAAVLGTAPVTFAETDGEGPVSSARGEPPILLSSSPPPGELESTNAPSTATPIGKRRRGVAWRPLALGFAASLALAATAVYVGRRSVTPAKTATESTTASPTATAAAAAPASAPATASAAATASASVVGAPVVASAHAAVASAHSAHVPPGHPFDMGMAVHEIQFASTNARVCLGPRARHTEVVMVDITFSPNGQGTARPTVADPAKMVLGNCVAGSLYPLRIRPFDGPEQKFPYAVSVVPQQ